MGTHVPPSGVAWCTKFIGIFTSSVTSSGNCARLTPLTMHVTTASVRVPVFFAVADETVPSGVVFTVTTTLPAMSGAFSRPCW